MFYLNKLRACGSIMSPRTPCNVAWGAIATAAAGALSSILGSSSSSSMNKRAENFNRWATEENFKENARNRQWQENFWNMTFDRESSYNNIISQRARARAAGVNPDLMQLSDGSVTGATSAGSSGGAMEAPSYENAGAYAGQALERATTGAVSAFNQTKETDASANLKDSMAAYNDVLNAGSKLDNILKGGTLKYLQNSAESQAKILSNQALASEYEAEYKQYVTLDARYSAMHSMIQATAIDPKVVEQMDAGIQQTLQSVQLMKKQGNLTDKQVEKIANDMLLGWSNLRVMQYEAQTNRQNANTNAYNAATNRMDVSSRMEQRDYQNNLTYAQTQSTEQDIQDKRVNRSYRVNTLFKGMKAYYDFQSKLYDAKGKTLMYNEFVNSATNTVKLLREGIGAVSDVKGIANPMQGSYQGSSNSNGYSFSPQDFEYNQ